MKATTKSTLHPQRTHWDCPWPGGTTGAKQSARGARSPDHEWAGLQGALLEWRRVVVVELGAWLWAAAAGEGECEWPPWPDVGAGVPSSPSWGCTAEYQVDTETSEEAGACGGDAIAVRRRGYARWEQLNHGHASGCCGWSTLIHYRCQNASLLLLPLHLLRGIYHLRPQCCQDL